MPAINSAWVRSVSLFACAGLGFAQQFFDSRVEPILSRRCLPCHNELLKDGGLSFLGREGVLKGGSRGPAIVPGKPEQSLLMHAIRQDRDLKMPPGAPLPPADMATLAEWIRQGAPWGEKLRLFELWSFDRIDQIGGHPTRLLGHPRVIAAPGGKAIEFNGVDDAIFLDVHPLAGADVFTWEVIFRPDPGGNPEQRFFHLQERDPKTGADTNTRMLLEIRVIGSQWCLDSFALSGENSRTLMNRDHLHKLGEWYHVAMVYDGHEFRNYVNGIQENSGELHLDPQGPGHTSIGVRINLRDYFKGAIAQARMTKRPLSPEEFLKRAE